MRYLKDSILPGTKKVLDKYGVNATFAFEAGPLVPRVQCTLRSGKLNLLENFKKTVTEDPSKIDDWQRDVLRAFNIGVVNGRNIKSEFTGVELKFIEELSKELCKNTTGIPNHMWFVRIKIGILKRPYRVIN